MHQLYKDRVSSQTHHVRKIRSQIEGGHEGVARSKPYNLHTKPNTPHLKPETRNLKPQTQNPTVHARPFVGVFQKSIYKRTCQLLAINARTMAPRTRRWLQERQGDAPTKSLAWIAVSTWSGRFVVAGKVLVALLDTG